MSPADEAGRITRLAVSVTGRPAPQGSKHHGDHGQMREASAYLPAWRAAVKRAVYARYLELGVDKGTLPLLRGPVGFSAVFRMPASVPVDGPPDLDKLLRSTWDALTQARAWEDDGKVVHIGDVHEVRALEGEPAGADIEVWTVAT